MVAMLAQPSKDNIKGRPERLQSVRRARVRTEQAQRTVDGVLRQVQQTLWWAYRLGCIGWGHGGLVRHLSLLSNRCALNRHRKDRCEVDLYWSR